MQLRNACHGPSSGNRSHRDRQSRTSSVGGPASECKAFQQQILATVDQLVVRVRQNLVLDPAACARHCCRPRKDGRQLVFATKPPAIKCLDDRSPRYHATASALAIVSYWIRFGQPRGGCSLLRLAAVDPAAIGIQASSAGPCAQRSTASAAVAATGTTFCAPPGSTARPATPPNDNRLGFRHPSSFRRSASSCPVDLEQAQVQLPFCGAFSYVASSTIPRRFLGSSLCWTPHNFRSTGFAGTP